MGTNKTEMVEKLQLFEQVLKNVDTDLHQVDVIDFYEIVEEMISYDALHYSTLLHNHCSQLFLNFVNKNFMGQAMSREQLLSPNTSYGIRFDEKHTKFASRQELIAIYNQLTQRKIPVCPKTVLAQLRRNWKTNTDYHYPDLPMKENAKTKTLKK